VAEFLEQHPNVNRVKYPFLKHPQYEIKTNESGNIVAFEIIGG
jgi:O-succinylhomoserine sulfhydrylase